MQRFQIGEIVRVMCDDPSEGFAPLLNGHIGVVKNYNPEANSYLIGSYSVPDRWLDKVAQIGQDGIINKASARIPLVRRIIRLELPGTEE